MSKQPLTLEVLERAIERFKLTGALILIRDARSVKVHGSQWIEGDNCFAIDCDKASIVPDLVPEHERGKAMVICSLENEGRVRELVDKVREYHMRQAEWEWHYRDNDPWTPITGYHDK